MEQIIHVFLRNGININVVGCNQYKATNISNFSVPNRLLRKSPQCYLSEIFLTKNVLEVRGYYAAA